MSSSHVHPSRQSFDDLYSSIQGNSNIYALFDGASEGAKDFFCDCYDNHKLEIHSLVIPPFDAPPEELLSMPHLIRFDQDRLLYNHCRSLLGKNAFILVCGVEDMMTTISMLEKILWVIVPSTEKPAWFRFYSPNILNAFLSQATEQHLATFFNEILTGYWAEDIPATTEDSGQEDYARAVTSLCYYHVEYDQLPAKPDGMMQLFPEHLDRFEEKRSEYFIVGLCRHIAKQRIIPDYLWPDMRKQVGLAIDEAAEYGITSYPCLCLYIDAACRFDWDFALSHPELKTILPHQGLPENVKEEILRQALSAK